jgi:hypothetical protein
MKALAALPNLKTCTQLRLATAVMISALQTVLKTSIYRRNDYRQALASCNPRVSVPYVNDTTLATTAWPKSKT